MTTLTRRTLFIAGTAATAMPWIARAAEPMDVIPRSSLPRSSAGKEHWRP
jgi:hypothetical protein